MTVDKLREERDSWQSLLSHPMWKVLAEYAEAQKTSRIALLLNGTDNIREEDKLRGEVLGIGLFFQYPQTMVEAINVELDNLKQGEAE